MVRHLLSVVTLSAVCLCLATEILPHLRDIDDSIAYRINYLPRATLPSNLLEDQMLPVVSVDNEPYLCTFPELISETKRTKINSYSGPSPAELIAPMNEEQCAYRNDGYWTYEICHGRYIRQFHEEKGGSIGLEYYMGYYRGEEVAKEARVFDELNPPTKRIDDKDSAYYSVVYRQGSLCDISGSPRVTTMNYVCWPNAEDYIHSVRETSSCVYEIFIYTKRLCSHPSFPAPVSKEHDLNCYAKHDVTEPRPKSVLRMEEDLKKSFRSDYKTRSSSDVDEESSDEDPTAFKIKFFDELDTDEYKEIIRMLDSLPDMEGLEKYKKEMVERIREKLKKEAGPKFSKSEESDGSIGEILSSRCLKGGTGWWRYELCYGQKVTQYHEEKNGERTEIVLGYFDQKIHEAFIEQNPKKGPVIVNGMLTNLVTLISVFSRSVEVRMRCRPNAGNLDISLFLLEPSTCQYVLGVDSPLLCSEMQTADDFGLMSMDRKRSIEETVENDVVKDEVDQAAAEVKPSKAKFKKEVVAVIHGPAATSTPTAKDDDKEGHSPVPSKPEL
ncbi:hypothetical protein QR680_009499 [Steinernema hermaphroditum]|uniref:Endoplasmic reticulum lectin 1 n=1 Tax=Steinernema hermaphroditum TaxID=289476 RepID=A0AA39IKH0_9BILA|nr:hypothetical protein QR680_009499 [Steinernema hermaphroditum]